MIIPKANKLDASQLKEVEAIAADFECSILEIQGRNRCVYAILGDEGREVMFKNGMKMETSNPSSSIKTG